MAQDIARRLIARSTVAPTGCRLWNGALTRGPGRGEGYGRIRYEGRHVGVHRVAFLVWVGPIPDGETIDHLCHGDALARGDCSPGPCDHRRCIEPTHLRAVTIGENLLAGGTVNATAAARTHCIHGHPLWGDNLMIRPGGKRRCRTCHREQVRRWRQDHSLAAETVHLTRVREARR